MRTPTNGRIPKYLLPIFPSPNLQDASEEAVRVLRRQVIGGREWHLVLSREPSESCEKHGLGSSTAVHPHEGSHS